MATEAAMSGAVRSRKNVRRPKRSAYDSGRWSLQAPIQYGTRMATIPSPPMANPMSVAESV